MLNKVFIDLIKVTKSSHSISKLAYTLTDQQYSIRPIRRHRRISHLR
jgi:hypothetical protein